MCLFVNINVYFWQSIKKDIFNNLVIKYHFKVKTLKY